MLYSTLALTIVCLIAAGLLGLSYGVTYEAIEGQKIVYLDENLLQVFPDADNFQEKEGYYIAVKGGEIKGYLTTLESGGYAGMIEILVGINLEGELTGIRILDHEETPGLGGEATKPEFYEQFDGIKVNDIKLKQDGGEIDGITAATITSRAITKGVKEAVVGKLGKLVIEEQKSCATCGGK